MNLRDLKYLTALADYQHFGKAATACFVSQPTLSTQIKKVEEELGVTIFERAPGNVMLTPIGEQIIARAREVLREVDEMLTLAKRSQDPESGEVRLGIFPTLGPYLLPHMVPALHKEFERIEWFLIEEKTDNLTEQLKQGKLDAALLAMPINDEQLTVAPLFKEEFLLATPKQHALSRDKHLEMNDLKGETLFLLDEGHCLRDQALEVCKLSGAREQQDFRATSLETLRQMVGTGLGITLLPKLATLPVVHGSEEIEVTPFVGEPPYREIAMVWRQSSPITPTLQSVAEFIKTLPILQSL